MNFFFRLIFFTLLSISAFSQTDVAGTFLSDTEWTLAGSPYTLTSTVGIPTGVTLTIQAGVQVNGDFDLLIKGRVIVNGSNSQPVAFSNTRLIFKSADLSLSELEFINFNHGGLQLADESEFSYDSPKNSNTLVVRNSSFTNNGYARTKGYLSSAKLRLEDCSFHDATILGYYPWSEMIELVGATVINSTIRSDSYNYGINIQNSSISNSTFMMGCCDANFSITDSEITDSGFVEGGGSPVNGLVELIRVTLTDTYINLPNARFYFDECNVKASSIPVTTIITMGSGEIKKTTLEGHAALNAIKITGTIGNNTTGSVVIENATFKTFDTALEIADFATIRINQSNFLNSAYNLINTSNKSVDAKNNYWGTDDEQVIKDKIIDSFDNLNYGIVNYYGFLDAPVMTNPLLTPAFVYEGIHEDGTLLFWTRISNPDVIGYKIYKKVSDAYTFLVDVGNVNSFVLNENLSEEFVVTSYNAIADGINDQQEGNESAFSAISNPFIFLDTNNPLAECEGKDLAITYTVNYSFDTNASLHLIFSLTENFLDPDTVATISAGSSNWIGWNLPDTLTTKTTFYYRIASDEWNIFSESRSIEITPGPAVDFMIESIDCTPGAYQVEASGIQEGMIVRWFVDGISLTDNTEVSSFTATWSTEGERTLSMVVEHNGCETTVSKIVPVIIPEPLPIPVICAIESDEASGKNKVSWQYTHTKALEIKLYRETAKADEFELVATLPASEQNYIDDASLASQRAYRYRLSAVDQCGRETELSEAAKSFHLQLWPGIDDSWNLSWEARTENNEIEIYRRTDTDWQKIAGLASVHTSFTDTNLTNTPSEYYAAVRSQGSCFVSSNIVSNGVTSTEEGGLSFNAYPNPATREITFYYSTLGNYELHNMQGITVRSGLVQPGENYISVSALSQGIYLLKVWSDKKQSVTRVFKKSL